MEQHPQLRDSDIEALIAGRTTGAEDLDELARFVTTVKAVLPEALDPAVEQRHLVVLVEAAHLIQPSGSGQKASAPRSRTMLSTLFASLWMKVAAVTMTALAATGGLAAANALGPVQDTVASVGDAFGLDLPSSDDDTTETEDADDADEIESGDADDDTDEGDSAEPEDGTDEVESDDADEIESGDADDDADEGDSAEPDDDTTETEDADDADEIESSDADDDADEGDSAEPEDGTDEVESDDADDDVDETDSDEVEDEDDNSDEESSEED